MRFDTADIARLETSGGLEGVVLHEIGHILGIGTLWDRKGFQSSDPSGSACRTASSFAVLPTYTGAEAVTVWQSSLGGSGGVPIEDTGGGGTQCSHWDEETFDSELMTGYFDGPSSELSALTIASLADLGYVVDASLADPYVLPLPAVMEGQGVTGERLEEVILPPIGFVDEVTGE